MIVIKRVMESLLRNNDETARLLHHEWNESGTLVVNLISATGSGKTTLLEATLPRLRDDARILVIEGDIETEHDAERIEAIGIDAVQITTGGACHLEAHLVEKAWRSAQARGPYDIVFLETVGNLVCPASYYLGEHLRVALLSVPEGDDKPAKYPKAFRTASAFVLTKIDLMEHFEFDRARARRYALDLQPDLETFEVSARTGEGLDSWVHDLKERAAAHMPIPG